mmetsp:Transcript_77867/g.196602  ORF Transcript_77867/g.196602 Transcript_77867/m.196602 type:complete len:305 (+) Transcript_77867:4906-5820(+)
MALPKTSGPVAITCACGANSRTVWDTKNCRKETWTPSTFAAAMARIALSESNPNCLKLAVTLTAAAPPGNASAEATASARRRSTRVGGGAAVSGVASAGMPLDAATSRDSAQLSIMFTAQDGASAAREANADSEAELLSAPTSASCMALSCLCEDASGFPIATGALQAQATDLTAAPSRASGGSQNEPEPPCKLVPLGTRATNMRNTAARPWTNVCKNSGSSCAVSQVTDKTTSSLSLATRTLSGAPARSMRRASRNSIGQGSPSEVLLPRPVCIHLASPWKSKMTSRVCTASAIAMTAAKGTP